MILVLWRVFLAEKLALLCLSVNRGIKCQLVGKTCVSDKFHVLVY